MTTAIDRVLDTFAGLDAKEQGRIPPALFLTLAEALVERAALALPAAPAVKGEPSEAQVEAAAKAMLREDVVIAGLPGDTAERLWASGTDEQRNGSRERARRVLLAAEAGRE